VEKFKKCKKKILKKSIIIISSYLNRGPDRENGSRRLLLQIFKNSKKIVCLLFLKQTSEKIKDGSGDSLHRLAPPLRSNKSGRKVDAQLLQPSSVHGCLQEDGLTMPSNFFLC
jgi:hypothetical protein